MGNGEGSGSGGRRNWPVDLAGGVGAGAGVALGLLVVALTDLRGFWPGMIAGCVGAGVGVVLGRLAGSLVFRRPPGWGSGSLSIYAQQTKDWSRPPSGGS